MEKASEVVEHLREWGWWWVVVVVGMLAVVVVVAAAAAAVAAVVVVVQQQEEMCIRCLQLLLRLLVRYTMPDGPLRMEQQGQLPGNAKMAARIEMPRVRELSLYGQVRIHFRMLKGTRSL